MHKRCLVLLNVFCRLFATWRRTRISWEQITSKMRPSNDEYSVSFFGCRLVRAVCLAGVLRNNFIVYMGKDQFLMLSLDKNLRAKQYFYGIIRKIKNKRSHAISTNASMAATDLMFTPYCIPTPWKHGADAQIVFRFCDEGYKNPFLEKISLCWDMNWVQMVAVNVNEF